MTTLRLAGACPAAVKPPLRPLRGRSRRCRRRTSSRSAPSTAVCRPKRPGPAARLPCRRIYPVGAAAVLNSRKRNPSKSQCSLPSFVHIGHERGETLLVPAVRGCGGGCHRSTTPGRYRTVSRRVPVPQAYIFGSELRVARAASPVGPFAAVAGGGFAANAAKRVQNAKVLSFFICLRVVNRYLRIGLSSTKRQNSW